MNEIKITAPHSIAATELQEHLWLTRCQLASPLSKVDAVKAARASSGPMPNPVDWRSLFDGLEAAGLVMFLGDNK